MSTLSASASSLCATARQDSGMTYASLIIHRIIDGEEIQMEVPVRGIVADGVVDAASIEVDCDPIEEDGSPAEAWDVVLTDCERAEAGRFLVEAWRREVAALLDPDEATGHDGTWPAEARYGSRPAPRCAVREWF